MSENMQEDHNLELIVASMEAKCGFRTTRGIPWIPSHWNWILNWYIWWSSLHVCIVMPYKVFIWFRLHYSAAYITHPVRIDGTLSHHMKLYLFSLPPVCQRCVLLCVFDYLSKTSHMKRENPNGIIELLWKACLG